VPLIARCLEAQQNCAFAAALAGSGDHYQSEGADAGWGCGYRNIQMLVAHLLGRSEEMREALFDGCGFVPDIPSLQALVEASWAKGWDRAGYEQLGGKLRGSHTWIGTTECAALLRSYRLRAEIVDFEGGRGQVPLRAAEVHGDQSYPVHDGSAGDTASEEVHPGVQCDGCDVWPITGPCYTSQKVANYDLCGLCRAQPKAEEAEPFSRRQGRKKGQEDNGPALMKWVWKYLTGEEAPGLRRAGSGGGNAYQHMMSAARRSGNRVVRSNKSPLYFQHEGHSRTIVGVECRQQPNGEVWSLLVLDPNQKSGELRSALDAGRGWQCMLKRGEHTLSKAEYQVLYVRDGLAAPAESEDSKVIRAIERF
jgi:hypothetical protein